MAGHAGIGRQLVGCLVTKRGINLDRLVGLHGGEGRRSSGLLYFDRTVSLVSCSYSYRIVRVVTSRDVCSKNNLCQGHTAAR